VKGEDRAFGPVFVVWNSAEGFSWLNRLRKTSDFRLIAFPERIFRRLRLFLPQFPRFEVCLEAVLPASKHTSALLGQLFNRNQPPHAHQILRHDGQPIGPIHTPQPAQLHLAQRPVQLAPAEDPFDRLAFALADRAPFIAALGLVQAVAFQIALHIFRHVRRHFTLAQRLDKLLFLILRVGGQRDLFGATLLLRTDGGVVL
jgi:hypothetical protein